MTDLVERLQMLQSLLGDPRPRNTVRDAIAEIERLRAALAGWRQYAYADLGFKRDSMPPEDVAAVQRFLGPLGT